MIRAKLDYACFLYDTANQKLLQKLNVLQNKCLRLVTGALRCSRIERLETESSIEPLRYRRKQLALNQAITITSNEDHVCSNIFRRAEIYNISIYQPFATRVINMKNEMNIPLEKIKPSKAVNTQIWEKYKKKILIKMII